MSKRYHGFFGFFGSFGFYSHLFAVAIGLSALVFGISSVQTVVRRGASRMMR